jgi:hypothetical protein
LKERAVSFFGVEYKTLVGVAFELAGAGGTVVATSYKKNYS